MIGILCKTPVHRMAGITDRHFADEKVHQKIDKRRQAQCGHGEQRLPLREEVQAGGNAHDDDSHSGLPIEILLNV